MRAAFVLIARDSVPLLTCEKSDIPIDFTEHVVGQNKGHFMNYVSELDLLLLFEESGLAADFPLLRRARLMLLRADVSRLLRTLCAV